MPLTLQDMRDDLRDALGVDSDDLPDIKTDKLINRSWLEIQNDFSLREKDSDITINAVADTREYDLADDHESFIRVTICTAEDLREIPLERVEVDEFAENYNSDPDSNAQPTSYTPRYADKIWLNPTPDKAYFVTVYYKSKLPDITSDPAPQRLYDIILYGAIWRGFMQGGDHNRGVSAKAFQSSLIKDHRPQEDKDEKDSRMAGVEVITEENYHR